MNKTARIDTEKKLLVDGIDLQAMLSTGRNTAAQIGENAGAVVRVGRRKLYRVDRIEAYIASITETA